MSFRSTGKLPSETGTGPILTSLQGLENLLQSLRLLPLFHGAQSENADTGGFFRKAVSVGPCYTFG